MPYSNYLPVRILMSSCSIFYIPWIISWYISSTDSSWWPWQELRSSSPSLIISYQNFAFWAQSCSQLLTSLGIFFHYNLKSSVWILAIVAIEFLCEVSKLFEIVVWICSIWILSGDSNEGFCLICFHLFYITNMVQETQSVSIYIKNWIMKHETIITTIFFFFNDLYVIRLYNKLTFSFNFILCIVKPIVSPPLCCNNLKISINRIMKLFLFFDYCIS